jgi:hypothetical protein
MFSCVVRNNCTYHGICNISDLGTQHPIFSSWSPASPIPTSYSTSTSTSLCSSPLESFSLPPLPPPPRTLPLPRPLACSLPLPLPCPLPLPFCLSFVCSGASSYKSILGNLAFLQIFVREADPRSLSLSLFSLSLARSRARARALSLSTYLRMYVCELCDGWRVGEAGPKTEVTVAPIKSALARSEAHSSTPRCPLTVALFSGFPRCVASTVSTKL